jgi:quercetin dioxygenase-like cupin family protein
MAFHRFEELKSHHLNPHLSTAEGPVIEGEYMYFRMVTKRAGTGSALHYHPNELMAFPLEGKINCVVGDDRRIVPPGTFVHIPPYARHGFTACEDGDLNYLYIKDRTWTLIGAAADEALPDKALSATEVRRNFEAGKYPGKEKAPEKSEAIVEGLGNCYYPMIDTLDSPASSGHWERWVEGTHIAFGFVESPPGHTERSAGAPHEIFAYIVSGEIDAEVEGEKRTLGPRDVIQVPRGASYRWTVRKGASLRYALVRSLARLEEAIHKNGAADNWRG